MSPQMPINVGAAPNDNTGDPLREAFQKANTFFSDFLFFEQDANSAILTLTADVSFLDGEVSANASSILTLSAYVDDVIAVAIASLEANVDFLNDEVDAQAQSILTLESRAGIFDFIVDLQTDDEFSVDLQTDDEFSVDLMQTGGFASAIARLQADVSYTVDGQVKTATALLELESYVDNDIAVAIATLQADVYDEATGLSATATLAIQAQSTADGNAMAIASLTTQVEDPENGLSATNQLAQQAETTADGAASAVQTLGNAVNDETTGLSATNQLAQDAKTTADGAASAITSLSARVDTAEDDIVANAGLILTAQQTADGALAASATLTAFVGGEYEADGDKVVAAINLSASTVDGARVTITGDTVFENDVEVRGFLTAVRVSGVIIADPGDISEDSTGVYTVLRTLTTGGTGNMDIRIGYKGGSPGVNEYTEFLFNEDAFFEGSPSNVFELSNLTLLAGQSGGMNLTNISQAGFLATTSTIGGSQNSYNPGPHSFIRINTTSFVQIGGIQARTGRFLWIFNAGPDDVQIMHQNVGATASERIFSYTGASVTVPQNSSAMLYYSSVDSRWILLFVS